MKTKYQVIWSEVDHNINIGGADLTSYSDGTLEIREIIGGVVSNNSVFEGSKTECEIFIDENYESYCCYH